MNAEQRKLIVKEIENWRRSKLLPEHYCDFLLNLYLDDHSSRQRKSGSRALSVLGESSWKYWMSGMAVTGLISLFVLNFTSFDLPMQIGISALLVAACYMIGATQRSKWPLASYLCFGIGSAVLLYVGLFLLKAHHTGPLGVIIFVACCSTIWMVTGIMARLAVLHFCGWTVLLLVYGWFLQNNLDHFDWTALQMGWVPACIVLCWLGWLFHHSNKQAGAVLLVVGCLTWFVPEAFGYKWSDVSHEVLQVSFLVKLMVAGVVVFTLRKKWIEWVA